MAVSAIGTCANVCAAGEAATLRRRPEGAAGRGNESTLWRADGEFGRKTPKSRIGARRPAGRRTAKRQSLSAVFETQYAFRKTFPL